MKTIPPPDNEETLGGVLREWVVDAPLPPRFQDQVWQRIARGEAGVSLWVRFVRLIEVGLPRPAIACSYMASILVLGVVAGSVTAQVRSSRLQSSLGSRYVQSVDPYHAGPSQP